MSNVPYYDGPVWNWYGLSYSSYTVLPRRALQSMPEDWQKRFVALMDEATEALPPEAIEGEYLVRLRKKGKFVNDPNVPYKHAQPWPLKKRLAIAPCTNFKDLGPLEICTVCGGEGSHENIRVPE